MANRKISLTVEDHIGIVTIDNPPLNVMDRDVINGLEDIVEQLEADETIVAVILTGAGQKAFMAGADIKSFPALMRMGAAGVEEETMRTHRILNRFASLRKPVIAALNGLALGGGCELALLCDLRVAAENVQIGLPEIKLGLFPGGGGTQRLPRLIGETKAKELMFTGEPVSAAEAYRIGLVNQVVPAGEASEKAKELARKIASYSLPALSLIKEAVERGMNTSLEKGIEIEANCFGRVFQTEDIKEGVQAFIEKRKPQFTHR